MHELSLVMGVIDLAREETDRQHASAIEQIVLDIGTLSGVEMESFEFAWNQAVRGTLLEGAERIINRIPGKGKCLDCETEFPLHQYYDPCPNCGEHLIGVISGKETRVKTLTLRITD
jgi:hydrogenase nickel incorporation protein HypA/HybF